MRSDCRSTTVDAHRNGPRRSNRVGTGRGLEGVVVDVRRALHERPEAFGLALFPGGFRHHLRLGHRIVITVCTTPDQKRKKM